MMVSSNPMCSPIVLGPGAAPGFFFKTGSAKIKDWQNFGACGDRGCLRGMCPLRSREKLLFSKSVCTIWCIFFAWGAHTKSGALSLQLIEGGHAGCAHLKTAPKVPAQDTGPQRCFIYNREADYCVIFINRTLRMYCHHAKENKIHLFKYKDCNGRFQLLTC